MAKGSASMCHDEVDLLNRLYMNVKKRLIYSALALLILVFGNGSYYVFHGQDISVKKLKEGKDLNFYEKCSIYSMHVALWCFGWPISPQAARECFMLHLPQKDTVTIRKKLSSPKIEAAVGSLKDRPVGSFEHLAWNGDEAYSLSSPEHEVAIAVNPCRIEKECQNNSIDVCHLYSKMQYPKQSKTVFRIGAIRIPIQEGLFRYLQDKGWLSCFTARYKVGDYSE